MEVFNFTPLPLHPWRKSLDTHWTERWVWGWTRWREVLEMENI
jgi:hypothetical protein